MSLMERMIKNSSVKDAGLFSESKVLKNKDEVSTDVPMINVAFSGRFKGGFTPGVTIWAGPSRHFKTGFMLLQAKAYLDKYEDAVCIFYDCEFGSEKFFEMYGLDKDRVLHVPFSDIEQLKSDMVKQLNGFERGDHVIVLVDSLGNAASKKEVDDAMDGKSVADMTRAKAMKSLFRMITPHFTLKNIHFSGIAHTYDTMEMYSKKIVSGGCVEAGTLITMHDGKLKPVEDILVGESVKTLDGNKDVTYTWNPDTLENGTPECYEIEFEDGYKVVCSDVHKFMIGGEWVEAQNLVVGNDVDVMV